MTREQELLKAALLKWKESAQKDDSATAIVSAHRHGICVFVGMTVYQATTDYMLSGEVEDLVPEMAKKWPKSSGRYGYPIDDKESGLTSKNQYRKALGTRSFLEGNQGKLRHELVDFLLAELEACSD